MNNLKIYLPYIYKNILEFDKLMISENKLFNLVDQQTTKVRNNQYVLTADIDGIELYEQMLDIIANPAIESIEFRRNRIINRLSMTPPFTMRFLYSKLDEIIGKNMWTAYLDFDNYTLYIESAADNQMWYHEILVTVNKLKPANIVFINKPLVVDSINVSEAINMSEVIFNYRLGTSWVVGLKPFTSLEDKGVIKMGETPSIQPQLLNNLALFTADDIQSVRINNEVIVNDFITKTGDDNTAIIEYEISPMLEITQIILIELLDSNNDVLTSSNVYIPVLETIILKHLIKLKEGN